MPPLFLTMKEKIFAFLAVHYRRYHDVLFYSASLAVIAAATLMALQITRQKNELDREALQTRDIPAQEFSVGQKPIYVALLESGLPKQEVAQIVSKLGTVINTRKLQKHDTYVLSVENGQFIMLLLTQGFKRFFVANVDGMLVAGVSEAEIQTRIRSASGQIQDSLFNAMTKQGLQVPLILDFTDAFFVDDRF